MGSKSSWVSVKERLPENDPMFGSSSYVVVRSDRCLFLAYYNYKKNQWETDFKYHTCKRRLDVENIREWYYIPVL